MTSPLSIRTLSLVRLTSGALDEVSRLEQECMPAPWSHEALLEELERSDSFSFGFEGSDGELVAYLLSYAVVGELHILTIAVSPHSRRRGVALDLLNRVFLEARSSELTTAFLEVRESNTSALQLYETAGFTRTGLRKKYYQDTGESAIEMRRSL